MTETAALEGRVSRLENAVSAGFERIESLLQKEISELKTEQINDLRESNKRLADDQRRLWEQLNELQKREYERIGISRSLSILFNFLSGITGAGIAVIVSWFTSGRGPHP